MAKFHFRYEHVLNHRRTIEDRCQRDLAMLLRQRMILQTQLRTMQQQISTAKHTLADGLVGQVDLDRVSRFAGFSAQVTGRAHMIVAELARLEQSVENAREQLLKATRSHKSLQQLRERHNKQWELRRQMLESVEADDLASQLHMRPGAEISV